MFTKKIYKDNMYIFGGYNGSVYLNDLWKFNLKTNTWEDITKLCKGTIPGPRSRSAGALHGSQWYILSGWYRVGYYQDFYSFNLGELS
jgi:hypothetical protein